MLSFNNNSIRYNDSLPSQANDCSETREVGQVGQVGEVGEVGVESPSCARGGQPIFCRILNSWPRGTRPKCRGAGIWSFCREVEEKTATAHVA